MKSPCCGASFYSFSGSFVWLLQYEPWERLTFQTFLRLKQFPHCFLIFLFHFQLFLYSLVFWRSTLVEYLSFTIQAVLSAVGAPSHWVNIWYPLYPSSISFHKSHTTGKDSMSTRWVLKTCVRYHCLVPTYWSLWCWLCQLLQQHCLRHPFFRCNIMAN
jgi:hypothetical protein